MKEFIKDILNQSFPDNYQELYDNSPLLQYLDAKMGAIYGNSKSRRNLANIYAIYSILYFYRQNNYMDRIEDYKNFEGFEYMSLFSFYRKLYGGQKLQNHALNSRVNGEFKNKYQDDLIVISNGKYAIHINYLFVKISDILVVDISLVCVEIIEKYIEILKSKDNQLINDIESLIQATSLEIKKEKVSVLLDEQSEARIFEIISYAILKNYYKNIAIYIGFSLDDMQQQYLTLYKTGRTNANDGGIDFVMRPLGRFFQVSEVNSYDKYLLDIDKVLHFPITFVIKTNKPKNIIEQELSDYILLKSGGMKTIIDKYRFAIEEIITINELKTYLQELNHQDMNELLRDIDIYYRLELNLLADE